MDQKLHRLFFKVDQIFSTVSNMPISDMFILGNMLLNYESDFLLKMIKFGFALSVVVVIE